MTDVLTVRIHPDHADELLEQAPHDHLPWLFPGFRIIVTDTVDTIEWSPKQSHD